MIRRGQSIPKTNQGSVLLVALCFCAVLGIAVASYMGVCYQTLQLSSRNSHGTYSFDLAETGLEDALGALNRSEWTDWTLNNGASPKTATKTIEGFSFGSGTTGTVAITIENYDGSQSGVSRTITAVGTSKLSDGFTVTRKLKANAEIAPLFVNALASTFVNTDAPSYRGIYFESAGTVDSMDSALPGPFGASAVVSSANGITLVNAQINGFVAAATDSSKVSRPLLLNYSSSSNARVVGPGPNPMSLQIDQTRLSSSPYQPVFDIKALNSEHPLAPLLPSTETSVGNAGGSAIYYTGDLKLDTQQVRIVGDVTLKVSGDFTITGSARIVVPVGSSLQVVVTGPSSALLIGGNGIRNDTGKAKNVAIFYSAVTPDNSDAGSDNPEISTNQAFCGVVYAPNCNLDFIISSNLVFTGSLVAKTIHVSGSPTIHYDLDLRRKTTTFTALDAPFMVSSWQEIAPSL